MQETAGIKFRWVPAPYRDTSCSMKFSKLYIIALMFGLIGAVAGAFVGGFIAAARCEGGLECLGAAFSGVGLEAIVAATFAMSLAVDMANRGRGNLPLTFLATLALAVPIVLAVLLGFTAPLALPLFLFQAWVCVKVQRAMGNGRKVRTRARSG